MATKRQIAANRRNARKSTGPKTPEGKAASSMNALRHGLRAQKVVIPGEDREEFNQLHAGLQDQYQPQNQAEQNLVDQAVIAQWKLVRAEAFEAHCYDQEPCPNARAAILGRMSQIQCRLERAYFKAYKELERIKTARQNQPEQSKQPEPSKEPDKPRIALCQPPGSAVGAAGVHDCGQSPDQPPERCNTTSFREKMNLSC